MSVDASRIPLGVRLLPKRYFYGWNIAVAAAVMGMVTAGVGYYGLAVFLKPLQEEHGWSNAAVSGATSMYFVMSGVWTALIGPQIDKYGPKRFQLIGFTLIGITAASVGYVDALWQLYAVYITLALGSGFASGVAINAIMSRWFIRRRARAMSVSSTGVSWGGVILAPLGAALVERGGLALATPVLGSLVFLVTIPIVLTVLVFDPRDVGLLPDGDRSEEEALAKRPQNSALGEATQRRRWTLRQAMATVPFWAIIVAFALVLMAQTGFVIHQIAFLEERLGSQSAAARALSITAFGSIVARLAMGVVADEMDKRWLTVGVFVVQAIAVLLVLRVESAWATYFFILLFGMTIGNVYMMQSLLVSEIYGVVSFGAVFGIISMVGQMSSGFGPFAIGLLDDRTGSYTTSFTITASITLVAAAVVLLARPLPPPPAPPEEAAGAR